MKGLFFLPNVLQILFPVLSLTLNPSHDLHVCADYLHVRVGYLHVGNLLQLLYCCVSASDCIVTCCVVIGWPYCVSRGVPWQNRLICKTGSLTLLSVLRSVINVLDTATPDNEMCISDNIILVKKLLCTNSQKNIFGPISSLACNNNNGKCRSIRVMMKTLYHAFSCFTDAVKPTGSNEVKLLGQTRNLIEAGVQRVGVQRVEYWQIWSC